MRHVLAAMAAGLALSACATSPPVKPVASPRLPEFPLPPPSPRPPEPGRAPTFSDGLALSSLPGWAEEDHAAGLAAFQAGCGAARDPAVRSVCARARALGAADPLEARRFLEENFVAQPIGEGGVLTAYFAPEYEARWRPDAEFSAPVRPRPSGLVAAMAPPAHDPTDLIELALAQAESRPPAANWIDLSQAERATIDRSPAPDALAWMRPEDLFFLQIQGSGVLGFPDGRRMRAAYAADNGKPFVAIARPMVQRGIFRANGASGEAIRGWLASNRGPQAETVMHLNPRYVFFSLSPDDGLEPAGAAGVPLPAGRAIAVDPGRHAYGDLFWIDAEAPVLAGAHKIYRRLAVALDTGAAIRGEVRADLYIGRGAAAGAEAGRVRHTLRMVRLQPRDSSNARHETPGSPRGG